MDLRSRRWREMVWVGSRAHSSSFATERRRRSKMKAIEAGSKSSILRIRALNICVKEKGKKEIESAKVQRRRREVASKRKVELALRRKKVACERGSKVEERGEVSEDQGTREGEKDGKKTDVGVEEMFDIWRVRKHLLRRRDHQLQDPTAPRKTSRQRCSSLRLPVFL